MGFVLGLFQITMEQSLVSVIINRLRIALAVASDQVHKQEKGCANDDDYTSGTADPALLTYEHSTSPFCAAAEESQCSLCRNLTATEKNASEVIGSSSGGVSPLRVISTTDKA